MLSGSTSDVKLRPFARGHLFGRRCPYRTGVAGYTGLVVVVICGVGGVLGAGA